MNINSTHPDDVLLEIPKHLIHIRGWFDEKQAVFRDRVALAAKKRGLQINIPEGNPGISRLESGERAFTNHYLIAYASVLNLESWELIYLFSYLRQHNISIPRLFETNDRPTQILEQNGSKSEIYRILTKAYLSVKKEKFKPSANWQLPLFSE